MDTHIRFIRFSQSTRYALGGMAYLTSKPADHFCLVEDVAKARGLPKDFLAKIFQRLARQGLIISKRGFGGGYFLAKPAQEISLAQIVEAVEEPSSVENGCLLELKGCSDKNPCAIHEAVARSEKILFDALHKLSLKDLAERVSLLEKTKSGG